MTGFGPSDFKPLAEIAHSPAHINPGKLPELSMVPLAELVVDDRYQRAISRTGQTTITRIMDEFSWSKFSPVIVAKNEVGSYSIIDGQHRSTAALSLGYSHVPCMIVEASPSQAAGIFAAINGTVTAMTAQAVFKAARAAGVAWALSVDRACRKHGVTPLIYPVPADRQKPLMTNAASCLRRIVERHGEAVLNAVLSCVVVAKDAQQPGFLKSAVLSPWGGIFASRPGWVRDQTRLRVCFADTMLTLVSAPEFERRLEQRCGDGRSDKDDWPKVVTRVEGLHGRFPASFIAAQLRLPYADVNRAIEEIEGRKLLAAKGGKP